MEQEHPLPYDARISQASTDHLNSVIPHASPWERGLRQQPLCQLHRDGPGIEGLIRMSQAPNVPSGPQPIPKAIQWPIPRSGRWGIQAEDTPTITPRASHPQGVRVGSLRKILILLIHKVMIDTQEVPKGHDRHPYSVLRRREGARNERVSVVLCNLGDYRAIFAILVQSWWCNLRHFGAIFEGCTLSTWWLPDDSGGA